MGRLSIGQKADRALKLLMGLRNPRVAEALHQYGFKDADREEGWRLLKELTDGRLQQRAPVKQDPVLLSQLDEWENRWFPIASATLKSRFPEVHEVVFLNLLQTEGPAVIISVGTFLQRIEKLGTDPALERGAQARQLLSERGLNAATLQSAKSMLEALGTVAPSQPAPTVDPAQQLAAEEALWRWYLEWGEIARVAVKERRLLRELGFLNTKRPLSDEEPDEEPVETGAGLGEA